MADHDRKQKILFYVHNYKFADTASISEKAQTSMRFDPMVLLIFIAVLN